MRTQGNHVLQIGYEPYMKHEVRGGAKEDEDEDEGAWL